MRKEDISEIISGIDEKYVHEAETYEVDKSITDCNKKIYRSSTVWKVLAVAVSIILLFGTYFIVTNVEKKDTNPNLNAYENNEQNKEEESITDFVAQGDVYYSQLTSDDTAIEITEEIPQTYMSMCVIEFEEQRVLTGCVGIIEGTIDNAYIKKYEYVTRSDKFENNGRLNHKAVTVVYEITVGDVWYGDFTKGDHIIIEDELFTMNPIFFMKKGHQYVIPFSDAGDVLVHANNSESVVEGDVYRTGQYRTAYEFHPQIEIVEQGYIVSGDWETLMADEKTNIIMDVESTGAEFEYYKDKMYLLSRSVFKKQMTKLVEQL
jgi:hypothetical protein